MPKAASSAAMATRPVVVLLGTGAGPAGAALLRKVLVIAVLADCPPVTLIVAGAKTGVSHV